VVRPPPDPGIFLAQAWRNNRAIERNTLKNTFKMSSTLPFFLPQTLLEKQVRIVRYGLALAASLYGPVRATAWDKRPATSWQFSATCH